MWEAKLLRLHDTLYGDHAELYRYCRISPHRMPKTSAPSRSWQLRTTYREG
jgi:hypothetical protein